MSEKELAQALYRAGLLTEEQIRAASAQRTPDHGFAEVIVQNGWVTPKQIASVSGSATGTTPWGTVQPTASAPPPPPAPPPYSAPPVYSAPAPIPEPSGYIPPPSYAPSMTSSNAAQQSGMGASSVLPQELQGFSWAAFLMSWIWGIAHNTWIALASLVIGFIPAIGPIAGLAFSIWLGIKGNELAWQNRRWESIEQFRTVQRIWLRWGLGLIIFSLLCLVLIAMLTLTGRRISNTFNPAGGTTFPQTFPAPR